MVEWVDVATILGSGTLGAFASKLVEWRKAGLDAKTKARQEDREAETKLVQDLRAMLLDERKLVQDERAAFHDERKGHLDCLDRVLGVERQLVDIQRESAATQREHAECPGKISKLESQVEELRGLALERYTRSDPPPA